MSYIKVYLHCVWSTKKREPLLHNKARRMQLFGHIMDNARVKGIHIDTLGGEKDHVHLLLSLGSKQCIADTLHLIKGEASHWFNSQFNSGLQWQDDYFAVSIGQSQLNTVRNYIRNQEEHHRKKTFNEEYNEFISIYEFEE